MNLLLSKTGRLFLLYAILLDGTKPNLIKVPTHEEVTICGLNLQSLGNL
jgi:hypothetical protein